MDHSGRRQKVSVHKYASQLDKGRRSGDPKLWFVPCRYALQRPRRDRNVERQLGPLLVNTSVHGRNAHLDYCVIPQHAEEYGGVLRM